MSALSLSGIVEGQAEVRFGFLHSWHLFTPWGLVGFLLFLTAAAAEANRTPFDLPEAESEIIAGYFTEYSGFKFAIFFLAEYLGLFAMCGLGITLFLGGWLPPFKFLGFIPSWCWFLGKLIALILLFIWLRGANDSLNSLIPVNDPAYALWMQTGYDAETGTTDPRTPEQRFADESLAMHDRTNATHDRDGDLRAPVVAERHGDRDDHGEQGRTDEVDADVAAAGAASRRVRDGSAVDGLLGHRSSTPSALPSRSASTS